MTTEIIAAKKTLIKLMCDEAKRLIINQKSKLGVCNIGWVDYITPNLVQHEFVAAYIATSGRIILVEADDSEATTNIHMDEVEDIEKLEWILSGLSKQKHNK